MYLFIKGNFIFCNVTMLMYKPLIKFLISFDSWAYSVKKRSIILEFFKNNSNNLI